MSIAEAGGALAGIPARKKFVGAIFLSTLLPFLFVPMTTADVPNFTASVILVFTMINSLHIGATFWFYADPDFKAVREAHPAAFYTIPLALLVVVPAAYYWLGAYNIYLIVAFQVWANYHYGKQNVGLYSLIAIAEKRAPIAPEEKKLLIAVSWGGAIGATYFFSQVMGAKGLPSVVMSAIFYAGAAIQIACVAYALFLLVTKPQRFTLATGAFLLLACAFFTSQYLFASPLISVGIYAYAHGAQYVLMVGLVSKPTRQRLAFVSSAWLAIILFPAAFIFLGGYTQFTWLPNKAWTDIMLAASIAMVMGHFVVDAVAWRLRDTDQRKYVFGRLAFLFK